MSKTSVQPINNMEEVLNPTAVFLGDVVEVSLVPEFFYVEDPKTPDADMMPKVYNEFSLEFEKGNTIRAKVFELYKHKVYGEIWATAYSVFTKLNYSFPIRCVSKVTVRSV